MGSIYISWKHGSRSIFRFSSPGFVSSRRITFWITPHFWRSRLLISGWYCGLPTWSSPSNVDVITQKYLESEIRVFVFEDVDHSVSVSSQLGTKSLIQSFLRLNTSKLDRDCRDHEVQSPSTSQSQPHTTLCKQTGVLLLFLHFLMRGYARVSLLWWFVHGQSTPRVLLSFNLIAILFLRLLSAVMYRSPSFLGLAWKFKQSYILLFFCGQISTSHPSSLPAHTWFSGDTASAFFQWH